MIVEVVSLLFIVMNISVGSEYRFYVIMRTCMLVERRRCNGVDEVGEISTIELRPNIWRM